MIQYQLMNSMGLKQVAPKALKVELKGNYNKAANIQLPAGENTKTEIAR